MFALTVAFWGMTLQASEPVCMVKATVVRIMAPAWALITGSTFSSTGLNSHRLPKTHRRGKEAYGARVSNMAATSFGIFRRKRLWVSTSWTKSARRAMGEWGFGALEWPPSETAVKRTSAFPFSKTPIMAKLPGIPAMGSRMIPPPSSQTSQGETPLLFSSATSFGQPSPLHSSVQEEERYTSFSGTYPSRSSSSAAWKKAMTEHFVSEAPRPQTFPSAISPEKGG